MRSDDCLWQSEYVKFISMKAWWLLAVYQGFCAIREDDARKFKHYPCKNIPDIISFSPYDCFSLNLGHILFNGSGLCMCTLSLLEEKAMFHKFKISTCVFILCLFGLTLMTVTPVFAVDDDSFTVCDNKPEAEEKLSCFREIVRTQRKGMENLSKASRSQEAIADEAVSKSADLVVTLEAQIDDLNIQLTAAESASKAAEAQIADLQSQLTAVKLHQEDVDAENALLHADVKTLTAERDAMQEQVTKVAATRDTMIADLQSQLAAAQSGLQDAAKAEAQIADLQSQLAAAQSGSQDAAKAAEKVELLLAFIDKQGSGDTSTIEGQYGGIAKSSLRGEPTRKNWYRCTDCRISYDEIQDLKARLKD